MERGEEQKWGEEEEDGERGKRQRERYKEEERVGEGQGQVSNKNKQETRDRVRGEVNNKQGNKHKKRTPKLPEMVTRGTDNKHLHTASLP